MKTFSGKEFLSTNAVKIELSNGSAFEVREIPLEVLDEIGKASKEAEAEGEGDSNTLRTTLAKLCGCEESSFDGLGMVELKGATDFLFSNLLGVKSQQ